MTRVGGNSENWTHIGGFLQTGREKKNHSCVCPLLAIAWRCGAVVRCSLFSAVWLKWWTEARKLHVCLVQLHWNTKSYVTQLLHKEICYQRKINCIFPSPSSTILWINVKGHLQSSSVWHNLVKSVHSQMVTRHIIHSLTKRLMCFSI